MVFLTYFTWVIGLLWTGFLLGALVESRGYRAKREMLEFDLEEMTSQRDALSVYAETLEDRISAAEKE